MSSKNCTRLHHTRRHGSVFKAVTSIKQLDIENGVLLFDVEYNDSSHFEKV
jgi:hypothetical protein